TEYGSVRRRNRRVLRPHHDTAIRRRRRGFGRYRAPFGPRYRPRRELAGCRVHRHVLAGRRLRPLGARVRTATREDARARDPSGPPRHETPWSPRASVAETVPPHARQRTRHGSDRERLFGHRVRRTRRYPRGASTGELAPYLGLPATVRIRRVQSARTWCVGRNRRTAPHQPAVFSVWVHGEGEPRRHRVPV